MTTNSLGHKFTVANVRSVLTPTPHAPFSPFDEHGLVLDLERIRGEKNRNYRRRLLETVSRRANSTYRGLVNAITRELGFEIYKALWINPKVDSEGSFIAEDPYIKFDGVYLYLYSNYSEGVLEAQLDRYEPGGRYEHLWRLVDRVNGTQYFQAGIQPDVDFYARSMCLLNQSNRGEVELETVKGSTKFRLDKWPVCKNTVYFSDRSIYQVEVDTLGEVSRKGRYHIDYMKGIITSYLPPLPGTSVRYMYHAYPFIAQASDVILHDVNNDNFMVKMFEQVLQDDGTYAHGIPTTLGKDIINELLTKYPMYWGA